MLPLPLYFSDEFRLMTAAQLLRGVQQSALRDSATLHEALTSLELTFDGSGQAVMQPVSSFPEYSPPTPTPDVFTTELANHHFNVCLKRIEDASANRDNGPATALVNPARLHPNCHPDAGEQQTDALVRKLVALAQIADEQQVCLLLTLPDESQLELWLRLLERLVAEQTLACGIGIELSAESRRLLPTLGYLERLSQDYQRCLPVRLFQRACRPPQHWAGSTAQLQNNATIRLNLAAACAFLESPNNGHLRPLLVINDPDLAPVLAAPHRDHGWSVSLLTDSTPLCQQPFPAEPGAPCLLDGVSACNEQLSRRLSELLEQPPRTTPIIAGQARAELNEETRYLPGAIDTAFGTLIEASEEQTREAFSGCAEAQASWRDHSPYERRTMIERFAALLTDRQLDIAATCALETGKPIRDCLLEIQDALVLVRQHLQLAPDVMATQSLPASEPLACREVPLPVGTLLALLPWSQPILQFCAMTSAALLTGNAMLVKPAGRASQVVSQLFSLLLQSGIPSPLVALLPGKLETTGQYLLDDYRLDGVMFCGSAFAATDIQRRLTRRVGAPMLPLLSDTGGRHAALIDDDQSITELLPRLLYGAFAQAGQHPASLRVIYVEEKIAEQVEQGLTQALSSLRIGAPEKRATDIGPLISREQMDRTYLHIERFRARGRLIAQPELKAELEEGYFVPPTLLRLYTLDELQEQIDGPVLHLIRFNRDDIVRTLDEINRSGFAMALTLFSGDAALCEQVEQLARVSEFNLNPTDLHPHNSCCPGSGLGLSGTAPRPGTADYLRALIRHQRICRPTEELPTLN